MSTFTNNQSTNNQSQSNRDAAALAYAATRVAETVFGGFGSPSTTSGSTRSAFSFGSSNTTPVTTAPFGATIPATAPSDGSGFAFDPTTPAPTGFGAGNTTEVTTPVTTRPRSTTIHTFGSSLSSTPGIFSTTEIRAQLPPTNKKIKSQEEYKRDNKFKLDTWDVLFNKLLLTNANLDENIIEYFIAQDHIPDIVLSKLSNYNWGQIFNHYPHTKNTILRGCENHIDGDDYSEILREAFEENNEYCPLELLKDIKKYIWIKKLHEAHPNIFCADAKKEFKLEPTNYLLD